MDLRVVFDTMENATLHASFEERQALECTQLALLKLLLDPARGVPRRKLHTYVK